MNELSQSLVEAVKGYLRGAEELYIAACVSLHKLAPTIKSEPFPAYCKMEFGLSAPRVSKMLAVGRFVEENQLTTPQLEGASMTSLYESLQLNKGAAPELILAEAKSNSVGEMRQKKRASDPCATHEFFCKNCSISLDESQKNGI